MSDYEMEVSRTIWNNKHGTSIVVKPDGDGLGLIEINQKDGGTITITVDEAQLVSDALLATAIELERA